MFEALAIALALAIGVAIYFGVRRKPAAGGTNSPPSRDDGPVKPR